MTKKNILNVEEAKPDRNGDSKFEVELEPGIEASAVRWNGQLEPKLWSLTLTHVSGLQAVVRERDRGTIELESDFVERRGERLVTRPLDSEKRVRTGTKLRHEAVKIAEAMILERYIQQLEKGDVSEPQDDTDPSGELTINEVFAELRRRNALGGGKAQLGRYERVMDTASLLWNGAVRRPSEITQNDVNYWFGKRCGRRVDDIRRDYRFPPGEVPGIKFPSSYNRRSLPVRNCSPWTAKTDFLELAAVFNTACKHKLISENPLDGLDFSDAQKGDRDPYYPERFHLVLPFLDEVDPTGALRFRVILTYETAMRPSTIQAVHIEDFLDSESQILQAIRLIRREALYAAKREKPLDDWAEAWAVENGAHGALYLRHLKGKGRTYVRIIPRNAVVNREMDRYLSKREDLCIESPLLFPDPADPSRPIDGDRVRQQYREAEALARAFWTAHPEAVHGYLEWWDEIGVNVEKYLDEREGDVLYPYRHLWEGVRDTLGWTDNRNASYVGGWTTQRMGGSQGEAYRKLNPYHMLAIMDGKKITEVIAESYQADRAKRILTCDSQSRTDALLQGFRSHTAAHTRAA